MFHVMYLIGLCNRRKWPEPTFEWSQTRNGFTAKAYVNNRSYYSDEEYPTPDLARDAAACQAYICCRNFSVNDGRYPGQRPNQGGLIQGLPVAIGTGRRQPSSPDSARRYSHLLEGGSLSGGSDSGSDRRSSSGSTATSSLTFPCQCGQAPVFRTFDLCETCLRRERY